MFLKVEIQRLQRLDPCQFILALAYISHILLNRRKASCVRVSVLVCVHLHVLILDGILKLRRTVQSHCVMASP